MAHSFSYCGAATCPQLGVNRKSPAQRQTDAIDPNVWSGRALQAVSPSWR
jgi:hypothetical protein